MDYKLLVILLILLIVILTYKQISTIKQDVEKFMDDTVTSFEKQSNQLTNKINTNMIQYVDKIKNISSDNIAQIRRINALNNQPIINNKYSETEDSDYMTTAKESNNNNNKFLGFNDENSSSKQNTKYYMSDMELAENSNEFNNHDNHNNHDNNDCKSSDIEDVIYPVYKGSEYSKSIHEDKTITEEENVSSNKENNVKDDINDNLVGDVNFINNNVIDLKKSFCSGGSYNKSELINNTNNSSYNSYSDIEIYNDVGFIDSESSDKNISHDSEQMSESETETDETSTGNSDIISFESEEDKIEVDINNIDKGMESIVPLHKMDEINNKLNNLQETFDKHYNESSNVENNESEQKEIINLPKKNKETKSLEIITKSDTESFKNKDLEEEVKSVLQSAYTGTITISKSQKKPKLIKSVKKKNKYNKLTIDNIKEINEYSIEELKEITKYFSLTITFVNDEGKRKPFNKKELYNNIKNKLSSKSNAPN